MASHFRTLQIADIRQETADCVSIAFTIPPELKEEFRFCQGQNITLRTMIGGEEVRRSYSICSSPLEGELRVAIKKVEEGRFSCFANERLTRGENVEVLAPTGKFYTELNPAHQKNYLAFAAGSGITPILSLIKATLAVEPGSHFTLVYGNRTRASIIFREQLEALKNRYMDRFSLHHVLSREKMDTPLYQGRIDAGKCEAFSPKLIDFTRTDEIFICGPGEMIFTVKGWLEQQGVDKKKIHFELFHTQEARAADKKIESPEQLRSFQGKSAKVTVRLDGTSHEFELPYDGESILEAALREGIDLPFACKGGVCATCRAKLAEGKVEMDLNYALEDDEQAAGFILTCQSHPRTEKVMVDFDAR